MTRGMARLRVWGLVAAIVVAGSTAIPAQAQQVDEARIRKLESEISALQRKVFPGGSGRFFTPETGGQATTTGPTLTPSTTATTDMLARLDAMEAQLRQLTSQVETSSDSLAKLTARVSALEPKVAPPETPGSTVTPGSTTGAVTTRPPVVAASKPSAERVAAVQAITKSATGDAGEDEYNYGFRLWEAKFYPEAIQQLNTYVTKYPTHARISYGRNLLGRAYLAENKPRDAAAWFLKNYQGDKQGARAGDSLLYLAQSMIASGDTNRACIALAEFGDTYPALAAGRLKTDYEANRKKVTCR